MTEFNILPKFLDEAVTPVAQSVGNTLSSIWTMVFGGIDIYAEKTKYKRMQNLEKFKEELDAKVSSVPVEKLTEPPLHIVGPTLEASKFYFESDELRKMFSNLIAASINIDTITKTHPAFVEIIKQLSPLDAKNLMIFKNDGRQPIVEYELHLPNEKGRIPYKTNVFLENTEVMDVDLIASSISNLSRLGLINIDYQHHFTEESRYKSFLEHNLYQGIDSIFKTGQAASIAYFKQFEKIDLKRGIVVSTPLGQSFMEICL